MFLALAMLVLAVQDPPPESSTGIRLEAAAWLVIPGGWITITQGSRAGSGTPLRVDDDLDLSNSVAPVLAGRWEFLENHAIGARASIVNLSGSGTVEESFIFHGSTFDAGREVHADQDFTLVEFGYEFTFLRREPFRATAHLGGEYWSYSGRIRTTDSLAPIDTKRSFDSGFWMAGLEVAWSPHPGVDIRGRAVGGVERSRQNFFDLEADALFRPVGGLSLFLGYRYHALRFLQSTNESDLRFQGPLLGVELSF
jgi:hypothetical protein